VNKPYYAIEFSAAACLVEIRVNDIAVLHMELSGQASSLVPVNFAITGTGSQLLSARILPLVGETAIDKNAKLSYTLKLFEITNGFDLKETLLNYTFPEIQPDRKVPVVQKIQQFNAEVPYNIIAWQNGQDISKIDDAQLRLTRAYNKLAATIKAGDYSAFRKAIENREHIMRTTMYLNERQAASRVNNLVKDFESGFIVEDLPADVIIQYYANGKMAALKRPNGDHALSAVNEVAEEQVLLDLCFYLPYNKTEFEIT
jgi:hypothetical protein